MDNALINTQANQFMGSGWAFPVTFSVGNYQLSTSEYENNVNESINIILQTNKGERNLESQFGSGLQQYFFRKMDETLKGEIRDTVKMSLLHNEPRITVKDVTVTFTDLMNGLIDISISYVYNRVNSRHNYVFPFHLNEGTNLR